MREFPDYFGVPVTLDATLDGGAGGFVPAVNPVPGYSRWSNYANIGFTNGLRGGVSGGVNAYLSGARGRDLRRAPWKAAYENIQQYGKKIATYGGTKSLDKNIFGGWFSQQRRYPEWIPFTGGENFTIIEDWFGVKKPERDWSSFAEGGVYDQTPGSVINKVAKGSFGRITSNLRDRIMKKTESRMPPWWTEVGSLWGKGVAIK